MKIRLFVMACDKCGRLALFPQSMAAEDFIGNDPVEPCRAVYRADPERKPSPGFADELTQACVGDMCFGGILELVD